ncbi:MAG: hypothetical protein OEW75_03855 [Cyclobacteriaceae bacterium]|nr:hypothetical protein [Cyclobacteriaceae bacterium]
MLLIGCSQANDKSETDTHYDTLNFSKDENTGPLESGSTYHLQDSILRMLKEEKTDTVLLKSPFKILYINNLAKRNNGRITIRLPFDLHGFDCGAPDCYTTEVSFSFEKGIRIEIPKRILVQVVEEGCIEGFKDSGEMNLVESSNNHLHYFSKDLKSSLIIMKDDPAEQYVYYFPNVSRNDVQVAKLVEIIYKMEDDENTDVPYRMTKLIGHNNLISQIEQKIVFYGLSEVEFDSITKAAPNSQGLKEADSDFGFYISEVKNALDGQFYAISVKRDRFIYFDGQDFDKYKRSYYGVLLQNGDSTFVLPGVRTSAEYLQLIEEFFR